MEKIKILFNEYEAEILKIGAEATIYKIFWKGIPLIVKKRRIKNYRHPKIDYDIRLSRTLHEAKLLLNSKRLGVKCPAVLFIDRINTALIMQFINGNRLRELIPSLSSEEISRISSSIGESVAKLHKGDIVHGDLTTSNIIINNNKDIVFIDYGLGAFTNEIEEKAVDIHLFIRTLESSHYDLLNDILKNFLKGYEKILGKDFTQKILKKVEEIRLRGRYISLRKKKI